MLAIWASETHPLRGVQTSKFFLDIGRRAWQDEYMNHTDLLDRKMIADGYRWDPELKAYRAFEPRFRPGPDPTDPSPSHPDCDCPACTK